MIPLQDARSIVERHFRVYEAREERVRGQVAAQLFFVMFPQAEFDRRYQAVREDLRRSDPETLCFLRREGGEDVLYVAARPPPAPQRRVLHLVLMLLTVVTLTMAGTWYWAGFAHPDRAPGVSDLGDPSDLLGGFLSFALPVMLVLGLHEMAHFVTARRHGLRATLPFFVPFPPMGGLPLGTLGAFISLRDPLPDRKTLFDVGASGPLAGFLVAVPLVIAGSWLTQEAAHPLPDLHRPDIDAAVAAQSGGPGEASLRFPDGGGTQVVQLTGPDDLDGKATYVLTMRYTAANGTAVEDATRARLGPGDTRSLAFPVPEGATNATATVTWDDGLASFGDPLLVKGLDRLGFHDEGLLTHPTFIAGWVGLLVTGFNLLPIGQLDGGHVARAVLGERMKYAAFAAVGFLILLALVVPAWTFIALLVVLMGVHHPPPLNDRTPLDRNRLLLGALVLLVLIVTFVPVPFSG